MRSDLPADMDDRRLSPLAADAAVDAGRVLGAAFVDDPVLRYYFEGDVDPSTPVRSTMTLAAALTVRHGFAWRLDTGAGLTGVALLLPPEVRDFPLPAVIAAVLRTPGLWRPRALRRHFGVTASVEAHRPAFPCWTLLSIGVVPARQHRGHGAWLLARVLDGLPAGAAVCLETASERNLPLYRRHGFAVTGEFLADGGRGPLTWSMLRSGASDGEA